MKNNQASDPLWSRLLKKRELIAYFILCRSGRVWNVGDIIDYLIDNLYVSRKVAHSIFRRLKRMKLLIRMDDVMYKCIPFEEYFEGLYRSYVGKKMKRSR